MSSPKQVKFSLPETQVGYGDTTSQVYRVDVLEKQKNKRDLNPLRQRYNPKTFNRDLSPPDIGPLYTRVSVDDQLDLMTKLYSVNSIPIIIDERMQYIPLISNDELKTYTNLISTKRILTDNAKELLVKGSKYNIPFISKYSNFRLSPCSDDQNVFLITLNDGTSMITYGHSV